jgi:hypothetical protein
VSSFLRNGVVCPVFRRMSVRADRYRQRAAETKDRAAQARDPSIRSAFENVAAGWVVLAEQVERIEEEKSPGTRPTKIIARFANRHISGTFWDYTRTITGSGMGLGLQASVAERPTALPPDFKGERHGSGKRTFL